MAIYKDPIHGRLKLIVNNSGGYNFNYHVSKISKENNLDEKEVVEVFRMTLNQDVRDEYINLLRKNYNIDYIRKLENTRSQNSRMKIASIMGVMSNINSPFIKMI